MRANRETTNTVSALIAMIGTPTDEELERNFQRGLSVQWFAVGDRVVIGSRGAWRQGLVAKTGRKLVTVEYTTRSALADVRRYPGQGLSVTIRSESANRVWLWSPLASGLPGEVTAPVTAELDHDETACARQHGDCACIPMPSIAEPDALTTEERAELAELDAREPAVLPTPWVDRLATGREAVLASTGETGPQDCLYCPVECPNDAAMVEHMREAHAAEINARTDATFVRIGDAGEGVRYAPADAYGHARVVQRAAQARQDARSLVERAEEWADWYLNGPEGSPRPGTPPPLFPCAPGQCEGFCLVSEVLDGPRMTCSQMRELSTV